MSDPTVKVMSDPTVNNVGPDSKGNVGPDTRTTSYQGNIPAGPEEQEFEALRASHSQDESERSYRQGKTDQTYIIPDDLPDPDGFLEFLAEFHKYNPLRSITPKLVASLIPHWMDSPEFRTSWVDVMKNIWDSEGIKKSNSHKKLAVLIPSTSLPSKPVICLDQHQYGSKS